MNIPKISSIGTNFSNKLLTNKKLLRGLEKISEHGATFSNLTMLAMTVGLRPLAIYLTPDVEKENKQYAMSNSIGSGLIKFALVESVALPLETLVKNIDKNPEKFLKPETIINLKKDAPELVKSRSYRLFTQLFKLGAGVLTAIPKSILTVALIPVLMDNIFPSKPIKPPVSDNESIGFSGRFEVLKDKNIFFTGRITDTLSKGIGKIIDNKKLQNIVIKNEKHDKDIAKHITAGTDILLTAATCQQTAQSKRIKENRKKVLIYNNIISTAVTLGIGYTVDRIVKSKTQKFIEKFKSLNAGDPKLLKYVEGINIIRPALIFASIYYGLLPIFSTYLSEKIDKRIK